MQCLVTYDSLVEPGSSMRDACLVLEDIFPALPDLDVDLDEGIRDESPWFIPMPLFGGGP